MGPAIPARMKRVEFSVDGERVHAELHQPSGKLRRPLPLVMLVHGLNSTLKEYFEFPARLGAAGFSVLALDFRGHGHSEGERGVLSKERALADIRGAVEAASAEYGVDAGRWALVGHSLGGALIIAAAPYLPTLTCLIAMAPPWRLKAEMNPFEYVGYNLLRVVNAPVRLFSKGGLRVPYKVQYQRLFADPAALKRAQESDFLQHSVPVKNYKALVRDLDAAESARAVQIPALVLVAEYDIVVGRYNSRRVFQALAGPKEYAEIKGSGHSMTSDAKRDEVLDRCVRFLERNLKGARA